jgi:hypothetical protein
MRICCDFGDPASYLAQTQVGGEVSGDSGHSHYVSVQPLGVLYLERKRENPMDLENPSCLLIRQNPLAHVSLANSDVRDSGFSLRSELQRALTQEDQS